MATSASLPPPGMGTLEMSDPPLVLDAASPAALEDNWPEEFQASGLVDLQRVGEIVLIPGPGRAGGQRQQNCDFVSHGITVPNWSRLKFFRYFWIAVSIAALVTWPFSKV